MPDEAPAPLELAGNDFPLPDGSPPPPPVQAPPELLRTNAWLRLACGVAALCTVFWNSHQPRREVWVALYVAAGCELLITGIDRVIRIRQLGPGVAPVRPSGRRSKVTPLRLVGAAVATGLYLAQAPDVVLIAAVGVVAVIATVEQVRRTHRELPRGSSGGARHDSGLMTA